MDAPSVRHARRAVGGRHLATGKGTVKASVWQGPLMRWRRRRRARRAQLAHAVWDLNERYGPAAHRIARSSARQVVGYERRRFWKKVAHRLRHVEQ